eukprot:79888_1
MTTELEMLKRHHTDNTIHEENPELISRQYDTNITFYGLPNSQLQVSHDQSNKCCKCKGHKLSRCPKITLNFFKPKIVALLDVIARYTALADMVLDIRLLYKSQLSNYLFLTVTLFLSIIAPYLLQYSCGVKLFTLRRTFEKLSGFKKIFVVLYLLPTGVLYFIFLDLYDLLFTIYALFQLFCYNQSTDELKNTESLLAQQLSMSRTNWEGLKRQRGVSQLMFETIPQVTIQGLLFFSVIGGLELTNITSNDLLISVASAVFSSITQIIKLLFEAHAVQESFFQYALTCFMARIGWVPFRTKIRKVLENDDLGTNHLCCKCCKRNINEENGYELKSGKEAQPIMIDYDIKYKIPFTECIHKTYNQVEYDFSENTLKDLMATLMLRKQLDENEYEWGEGKRLEINFHESLQLMSVAQLVNLLRICSERLVIIRGLNNPEYLNWENALNVSRNLKQDTTTLKFSRDLAGRPHLMSIYLSAFRLKEFAKSIYKRPKLIALTNEREKNRAGLIASHFERNAYDFQKELKLVHRNLKDVPVVQFNTCDDPEIIARDWVAKYMPDKMNEKRKRKIEDDVASQIIPISKSERIEYLLRKIKLLFKIRRRRLAEQELMILEKNSFCGDLFSTANAAEPYQMRFLRLLKELRRDGYLRKLSEIEMDRRKEEIENNGKCKKCFCCGQKQDESDEKYKSKYDEEEEDVINIIKYLDQIGELCLDFDDEKKKGIIYENVSIYEQCIKLDFDINATEVCTGESLIFTLIRKRDAANLRVLLFQYQIEKQIQINIDIHNLKGKSPLYYALREYTRDQTNNLYLLLLQANADPNFPCTKRAQVAKSPLYYLISQIHAKSDKNANYNYFYWRMINDLIYYGASLYHNETLMVARFLIPRKIDEEFSFDVWNKSYLKNMLQVCRKLKLSLNTIQDERNNNPIHLLLAEHYNCNEDKTVKDKNKANISMPNLDVENTYKIEENIKYLYKFFNGDLKWESSHHRGKNEQMVESKTDVTVESAATKYFKENTTVIISYLNGLKNNINVQYNEHDEYDEKRLEEQNISKTQSNIIKIMKELQRIHWKWMQSTNCDDNLPITATLTENDIPIYLFKTVQNDLNTKFKRESFVDSIKSNRFAMAIIVNYVIFQVKKLKHLKAQTLSWQVTDKYDNEEELEKHETGQRQETQSYLPSPTAQNDNKSICFTYDVDLQESNKTHNDVNKFEIFYSAIVESLSVGDLLTDIIVLRDLIATNNQWWTAFMLLFLLAPYLVSFCSLASIFQSREKDVRNVMCLLLITPFSLCLLIMLDVTFMMFVVGNLVGLLFCWCNQNFIHYVDEDKIFLKFNVTHMEIKGYRRLRTLSQLVFETIPQTILQIRMFYVLENYAQEELEVSREALLISIAIAFVHFCFEAIILLIESKAAQLSWFQYGVVCLNARLNWVPLLNVIFRDMDILPDHIKSGKIGKRIPRLNEVNWEKLQHRFCKQSYRLDYEFCQGSFRRLYTQITRIPRFTDGSETEVKPLVTLLKQLQDVTYVYLGDQSCKFVSLRDLSRLYRNSDNRIILNGHAIDWKRKVDQQHLLNDDFVIPTKSSMLIMPQVAKKMVKRNDTFVFDESVFGDFMQHGEVKALFAIWNGIKNDEKEKIDILALKKDSLLDDITDVRTMKRFWRHYYSFGNSCDECHIIYDRIVKYYDVMLTLEKRNKSEITTALTRYENMVLLMLFFTKGSIHSHRCPECNICWKEYIITKLKSEYGSIYHNPYTIDITHQLPKYIKLIYGHDRDHAEYSEQKYQFSAEEETVIKIPFILAECSDIFSDAIGEEIMKTNIQSHEPLFNTQNKNNYKQAEWRFIDDNGLWQIYKHKNEINEQFDVKYRMWENEKKKCVTTQTSMKYEDNLITIDLNTGEFFERKDNKGKYKIIVDYHSVPPKYDQVNIENQYERTVKRLRADSALEFYELEFKKNEEKQKAIFELFKIGDLDQNCIYILSSIIEYEPDAQQSYAIIKHHYDLKQQNDKQSYFDKILKLANKMKLRRGYDKLLLSMQRFYRKTKINIKPQKRSTLIGIKNVDNDILGIKELKVKITVNVTESKSPDIDEDDLYVLPIKQMKTELNTLRGTAPVIHAEHEETTDSVSCQLWLKLPPDLDKKQIESWNDILLKTITIDLDDSIPQYQKLIGVNLSENYTSLGAWNPKLYKNTKLEFEVRLVVDEEENYHKFEYNALIDTAEIVLITNRVHNPDVIAEIDKKFWIEHQAVQWRWQDEKKKLRKFDRLSNKQIERDYQKLKKIAKNKLTTLIIPITDGIWFNKPENKKKYQIRIVRSDTPHLYYQMNIASGSTRIVKREIIGWEGSKNPKKEKEMQQKKVKFKDEIKHEEHEEINRTHTLNVLITQEQSVQQYGNNNNTNEAAIAFQTQKLAISMSNVHPQQSLSPSQDDDDNIQMPEVSEFDELKSLGKCQESTAL